MVRFCEQGNQDNRIVIYDNKIIDYINFIMRAGDFADCSTEKVRFSLAGSKVGVLMEERERESVCVRA